MIQKLKNWLVVLKLTWGTSQILTRVPESLKNLCFIIGSLWRKYILFELQKYRQVIFHDTKEICKFWRKTDLQFEKDSGNLAHFHQNFSNLQLCMTMKNNPKFEEDLTRHFKTDIKNLTNFDSSTRNLTKLLFNMLLWPKYIILELRKVQRSYVWWHWRLIQNLKEKWLVLSKMTWGIWQICIGWNKWIVNLTKLFTHV